jgi:hypothetical protein
MKWFYSGITRGQMRRLKWYFKENARAQPPAPSHPGYLNILYDGESVDHCFHTTFKAAKDTAIADAMMGWTSYVLDLASHDEVYQTAPKQKPKVRPQYFERDGEIWWRNNTTGKGLCMSMPLRRRLDRILKQAEKNGNEDDALARVDTILVEAGTTWNDLYFDGDENGPVRDPRNDYPNTMGVM